MIAGAAPRRRLRRARGSSGPRRPKVTTKGAAARPATVVPEMSLIVCTVGRSESLRRLLNSLTRQSSVTFEVIIVDQNPADFLFEILDDYRSALRIKHVHSKRGLSKARNIGLKHVESKLVCFPDDDCWYPPQLVETIIAYFSVNPGVDVLLGRTVDGNGHNSLSPFRNRSGKVTKSNVWRSGNSNVLFIRRELANELGGFDEELGLGAASPFQSGEETDFLLRALQRGGTVMFDRTIIVHHEQVDALISEKQLQRIRGYSVGFGRVLKLHDYGLLYLFYRVCRSALRAVLALLQLKMPEAKYKALWAIGTLTGYFSRHPGRRHASGRKSDAGHAPRTPIAVPRSGGRRIDDESAPR